jgi:hypothetical protein
MRQQQARDTGNDIDAWIKRCFQARKLMPPPQNKSTFVRKALPWLRRVIFGAVPCWTDAMVYSLAHGYAGTLDAIAPHPAVDGLVLYEFKTSRYKVWPIAVSEAELQACAYAMAWSGLNVRAASPEGKNMRLLGLCTVHITPYTLRENLITDWAVISELQEQFIWRRHQFGARLCGGDLQYG